MGYARRRRAKIFAFYALLHQKSLYFGRVAAEILTIFGGEECKKPKFSRACGARIPYTVKKSICVYQLQIVWLTCQKRKFPPPLTRGGGILALDKLG